MTVEYGWLPGGLVQPTLLQECSELYSQHYGTWSKNAPDFPGKRIRFSVKKVKGLLVSPDARIFYARAEGKLIGYATVVQTRSRKDGIVTWVTQLVVHSAFRHQRIGTTLLFSIWGFSNHYAWGLVSANPYAVRALEKATRRRCSPCLLVPRLHELVDIGSTHVPYITKEIETGISDNAASLNTKFFVDHSTLPEKLCSVNTQDTPWVLGNLQEGWEWCAFTFKDQDQIQLSAIEIERMLAASDQITAQAYSRMVLTPGQRWTRHTDAEAQQIAKYCGLRQGARILDLGCGIGRHVHSLAARGIDATGIDYIDSFIHQAREEAHRRGLTLAHFKVDDCRSSALNEEFDAILCLYDVLGTYVEQAQNYLILENIYRHLKPGGNALLSVMNYELTANAAKWRFSLREQPDRLLELPPSQAMEATGDVFDPDHYMIDTSDAGVVYRKEQFTQGSSLPIELIVRDRRFRKLEIEEMCRIVGLDVSWSRYVRAGAWDSTLSSTDRGAKEILLLCKRPREMTVKQADLDAVESKLRSAAPNGEHSTFGTNPARRKKIGKSDMVGQAGVNLIATVVNQMGFLWHPTGLEAGIDGYIEIRDPATSEVTNCIIQVQSRATEQQFQGETADGFDYLCDERDLTYWLAGNAPVILIRSRPSVGEAYWVSLKGYFHDLSTRKDRRIHFDKRTDRFDVSSASRLAELAIPVDSGVYLSRLPRRETLVTNLAEIIEYPSRLFRAPTDYRRRGELWQRLKDLTNSPASEWVLADGHIYSFYDLTNDPWSKICDAGRTANLATKEFALAADPQKRNLFVQLLNQCLRCLLHRHDVSFDSGKECYFFRASSNLRPRKYSGRTVFSARPSKQAPERIAYCRHVAFLGRFLRFDDQWYLEITPTYLFTYNGKKVSRFHESLLSGIKQLERQNKTHLAQVRLWAELLVPKESLYDKDYRFLRFGALRAFDVDFGIDDAAWRPESPDANNVALQRQMFDE